MDEVLAALSARTGTEGDWLGVAADGAVVELEPPDAEGVWTLGVLPPWIEAGDGADPAPEAYLPIEVAAGSIGDWTAARLEALVVDEARPGYWGLLERHAEYAAAPAGTLFAQGGERDALLAKLLETGGAPSTLAHLQADPAYCVVRLELTGSPTMAASNAGAVPDTLRCPVAGRWGIADSPEGISANVLGQELDGLMSAAPCTLVLRISESGDIALSWDEVGPLLRGLEGVAPQVRELESSLATIPAREELERELQNTLGGRASVDLSGQPDRALALLGGIWQAKGVTRTPAATFVEVTAFLRDEIGRARKAPLNLLTPSILAEYFCGPGACYALVWSAGVDRRSFSVEEGPVLIELCAAQSLAGGAGAAAPGALGGQLIRSVLDAVPKAREARDFAFESQLGVVLAADEPMTGIDLGDLSFAQVTTVLAPIERRAGRAMTRGWDRLASLREDRNLLTRRCDYWSIKAIGEPAATWQGADTGADASARAWALRVVASAGEPTG
jgi:hypothetical protein